MAAQFSGFPVGQRTAGDALFDAVMLVFHPIFNGAGGGRSRSGQTDNGNQGCGDKVSRLHGILLCLGFNPYDAQGVHSVDMSSVKEADVAQDASGWGGPDQKNRPDGRLRRNARRLGTWQN